MTLSRNKKNSSGIGLAATVAVALGVSACQMDTDTEVYVGDVREVYETGERLTTPVDLKVEMPSTDQCAENRGEVESIMEEHLPGFEARECGREDFQAFLYASARIPVVSAEQVESVGDLDSLLGIAVSRDQGFDIEEVYALQLYVDPERLSELNRYIQSEYYQDIDIAGSMATVRINNDERETWTVMAEYAYVDGEPGLWTEREVERRDRVSVRLSDVARSHMAQYSYAPIGWVAPQQ